MMKPLRARQLTGVHAVTDVIEVKPATESETEAP